MKIKYMQDRDTLHIEIFSAEVGEARDFDENTRLDLDCEGRLCAIAIKGVSSRMDLHSLMGLPGGVNGLLNLTVAEQGWLDEYRRQLHGRFPGLVEDILIYGMYAHGYSRGSKDLNIEMNLLVIICDGDRELKDEVRRLGVMVDLDGFHVAPSILVHTKAEWAEEKRRSGFDYRMVADEGISVL